MSNASEPFKVNLPDGSELRLPHITPADWIAYTDRFRTDRKVRLTQTLRFAGIEGDELVKRLSEFDARKLRHYDVIQWVTELDGAAQMLALSVSRGWELWRDGKHESGQPPAKRGVEDIPASLPNDLYVEAAAGVALLTLTAKEPPDPKDKSQSTGTGDATPTESASGSVPAATTP